MKKIISFLVLLFFPALIYAQQPADSFSAKKGNFSSEGIFGLNSGPVISLVGMPSTTGGVKLRYFNSDNTAWRFQFSPYSDDYYQTNQIDQATGINYYEQTIKHNYALTIGMEKHINRLPKLSIYYGIDIGVIYNYQKVVNVNTYGYQLDSSGYHSTGTVASFVPTVNLVAGLDYYIIKHLFVGVEFGLNYGVIINLPEEYTYYSDVIPVTTTKRTQSYDYTLTTFMQRGIRLGFVF